MKTNARSPSFRATIAFRLLYKLPFGGFFFLSHMWILLRALLSHYTETFRINMPVLNIKFNNVIIFFFVVFWCLILVSNTELIPFTDLNKRRRGLSTSCTKTEPNQPGVAPPSLYDDVIWNQSPHGDAWGQQVLALAHFKNGAGLSSLSWHSNLCLQHLMANLKKWINNSIVLEHCALI